MSVAQIIVGACLAGVLLATVLGFPKRYGALSGRSRLFRTTGMGLILLLLTLVLVFVSSTFEGKVGAIRQLAYFASFVMLGLCLVCVALLDALEAIVVVRKERRAALDEMITQTVAAQAKGPLPDRTAQLPDTTQRNQNGR